MLSAFKNFLITFLIGAVLFGVIGFFTTRYVGEIITGIIDGDGDVSGTIINSPTDTENQDEPLVKPDPNQKVPEGDSFTFVVVGTDYRPDMYKDYYVTVDDFKNVIAKFEAEANKTDGNKDLGAIKDKNKAPKDPVSVLSTEIRRVKATWIALVRADKESREYVICYFSPETHVSAPCGDSTLGEVYGLYGIDVLSQYMNALTGLDVDYRFVLDGVNIESFVNSMGSVTFDLATDLYAGKKYHLSSPTTVLNGEEEDDEESSAEENKDDEDPKDNEDDNSKEEDKKEDKDNNKDKEVIKNVHVLDKGKQSLSAYHVNILNTFKELSQSDVDAKSGYILEIVTQYLKRCAGWSEADLTWKIQRLTEFDGEYDLLDPYAAKAVLATEFTDAEVNEIYSMLGAIEYFECKTLTYPGAYSEKKDVYEPDIKTGLEMFKKYRTDNKSTETNNATTSENN